MNKCIKVLFLVFFISSLFIISSCVENKKSFTMDDLTVTYDGLVHSLKINEELPVGWMVTYENNDQTEVGTYIVTANITSTDDTGSSVTKIKATLTITKADLLGISFEGARIPYDGNSHLLEIEGSLPEGVSVTYLNNGQTEIGSYEITAHFVDTTGNYNVPSDITVILEIYTTNLFHMITFVYPNKEKEQSYLSGTIITDLPEVPERKGYIGKWNYDFTKPITEDITCNIIYILEEYKITYYLNGGINNEENVTTYTVEDRVILLSPIKKGYVFGNWYLDDTFTKIADEVYENHTGDITLYAKWIDENFTINYYLNDNVIYSEEITYGSSFKIKNVEIENYQIFDWKFEETIFIVNETYEYNYKENLNLVLNNYLYGGNDFIYTYNQTTAEITGYSGSVSTLVIPSQITKDDITYLVTSIKDEAFKDSSNLTNVIIPASIKTIGKDAFKGCNNLISITIPFVGNTLNGTTNTHFGYLFGASSYFENNNFIPASLKEVIITGGNKIADDAFYNCNSLVNITLSSSIKDIGFEGFYNCKNLTNVYYNGTIADWCKITFSFYSNPMYYASCFYLKNSADEWQEITKIEVPDDIITIGDYQFYGFENLTSITIPSSVTKINYEAFNKSTNLTSVYYSGTLEDWCKIEFSYIANPMYYARNFYLKDASNKWFEVTEIEVPNTITRIGNYQFYGFENLTKITLPASITKIEYQAFCNCSALENIVIPTNTITIIESAFDNCSNLTKITLPASIKSIDKNVFSNCNNLISCYYEGTLEDWCKIKFQSSNANPMSIANIFYLRDSDNEWYEVLDIEIPKTITIIGDNQFYGFGNLRSVYYEGTLEDWCKITFNNISSNPMESASHFYLKDSTGTYQEITEIKIPNTITEIGNYQFYGFDNITKVTISNSTKKIGILAFANCFKLSTIVLPTSVTSIEGGTFDMCFRLYEVYFEGTLEEWKNIKNNLNDQTLTSANVYYYAETKPVESGKYWYYDNGEIKIWY